MIVYTRSHMSTALEAEVKLSGITDIELMTFHAYTPAAAWMLSKNKGYPNDTFALDLQYWSDELIVEKLRAWKEDQQIAALDYLLFIKGALWYRMHKISCN